MAYKKGPKGPKGPQEYICEDCDYKTDRKSKYDRHITTRKHQMFTNVYKMLTEKGPVHTCDCGKIYKYRQSLYKHKKTCSEVNKESSQIDPSLVMKLINENINLQKQMSEQQETYQKQISELIPCVGNNNNNKFNINVFLNETCKDAMTLTDFVNNLELTLSDLDIVGEHGYLKGMSDIFINRLKQIDITKRPIHCSDLKREILYIKNDELDWKKENPEKVEVTKAINQIHNNNFKQIQNWTEEHPHLMVNDHPDQVKYINIISNCTKDSPDETSKIVKNIAKETIISK